MESHNEIGNSSTESRDREPRRGLVTRNKSFDSTSTNINRESRRVITRNKSFDLGLKRGLVVRKLVYTGQDLSLDDSARYVTHVIVDPSVKEIEKGAFQCCFSLNSVEFPEDGCLESIGEESFALCRNLTEIKIPSTVKIIKYQAFIGCGLASVEIGEGVEVIEGHVFQKNTKLRSVKLPSTLKTLGNAVFHSCYSLEKVELPELQVIEDYSLCLCRGLKEIVIPKTVNMIGDEAFSNCISLVSVFFQDQSSLETIGNGTFLQCINLKEANIPSSCNTFGELVFEGCSSLGPGFPHITDKNDEETDL